MCGKHRRRRATVGGQALQQILRGALQNAAGTGGDARQFGVGIQGQPAFKHRHIVARMFARKGQIGAACRAKTGRGRGLAALIGVFHQVGENLVPLSGDLNQQILTALKMAVNGGGGDARLFRRLAEGKAGRAFLLNQAKGGIDQGLFQVAVVIAAFRHSRSPARRKSPDRAWRRPRGPCRHNRPAPEPRGSPPDGRGVCRRTAPQSTAQSRCGMC